MIDGLIGQYGSESVSMNDAHAIAPHKSIWHQPSAARGCLVLRPTAEPMLLPMPRPKRKTARISANV